MYFQNCKIRKCILSQNVVQDLLQYEIYYPSHLNKTSQRNLQHCTKLRSEVRNVLHNKIYWKIEFSVCFDFAKQTKNKLYILNYVFKLLAEIFH